MLHCNAVAILVYIFKEPYCASRRFLRWNKEQTRARYPPTKTGGWTYTSPLVKLACSVAFLNHLSCARVPVSGVIRDNYTKETRRREKKRKSKSVDLHWIGGVPVDVRQAGTGGLPREGLHHGQQQEKEDEPRHDVELNLEAVCVPLPGEKGMSCRSPAPRSRRWLTNW